MTTGRFYLHSTPVVLKLKGDIWYSKGGGTVSLCNTCFMTMKKALPKLTARAVFARNLRRARRLRDLSQETVALDAGMSRQYVSGVERGVRNVSIDNMAALADALDVALRDLVDPEKFKDLEPT